MIPNSLMRIINAAVATVPVPGNQTLLAGTDQAGWYGETSAAALMNTQTLASLIGLSAGTATPGTTNEPWLKFAYKGKTLFIAKRSLRHSLSWNQLNAINAVAGKLITFEGHDYLVRLIKGIGNPGSDSPTTVGSEWNDLMYKMSSSISPRWASYTNAQLAVSWVENTGAWTICQESRNSKIIARGGGNITGSSLYVDALTTANINYGWRPVLELVQ